MEDSIYAGAWWRFSEYELEGGYIRPVKGARLVQYSPLETFELNRSERGEMDTAHEALFEVLHGLRFDADGELTRESRVDVLAWCVKYGLLGLLLHQVQQVRFHPRWEPRIPVSEAHLEYARPILEALSSNPAFNLRRDRQGKPSVPADALRPTQRSFSRTPYGTFRSRKTQWDANDSGRNRAGNLVPEKYWSPESYPGVIVSDFDSGELMKQSVAQVFGRFFRDVGERDADAFAYPEPYSEEFWRSYAEPLQEFLAVARRFREAFLSAAILKDPTLVGEDERRRNPWIRPATSPLNSLVSPNGPALLRLEDGSFEQRLVSTSLLGSLALMAQQDLASERRVIRCANDKCRLMVVAVGYQTRYCSPQCRFAAEKRAQRAREKTEATHTRSKHQSRRSARPSGRPAKGHPR